MMELPNIAAYVYQGAHVWSALLTACGPPGAYCGVRYLWFAFACFSIWSQPPQGKGRCWVGGAVASLRFPVLKVPETFVLCFFVSHMLVSRWVGACLLLSLPPPPVGVGQMVPASLGVSACPPPPPPPPDCG